MDNFTSQNKEELANRLLSDQLFGELIDANNFAQIISRLYEEGLSDENFGEFLFFIAQKTVSLKLLSRARTIVEFLLNSIEDQSEAPLVIRLLGDIYMLDSRFDKARECYGQLPLTIENIRTCFKTYIADGQAKELLFLRDQILARIPESNHEAIHSTCNETMVRIASLPKIIDSHRQQFQKNIGFLKTVYPFNIKKNATTHFDATFYFHNWRPEILKIDRDIYINNGNKWERFNSRSDRKILVKPGLGKGRNIIICCKSPESVLELIDRARTQSPEFIKFECRVVIDFDLLYTLLGTIDFEILGKSDYVFTFIDSKRLQSELEFLLLDKKLPLSNNAIYFNETDEIFFSNSVLPILNKYHEIIEKTEQRYEKKVSTMYPDEFYDRSLKKISNKEKLRIIFFTSRFTSYMQYSTRDIAEGFKQLGHHVFIEIEEKDFGVSIRKDVCLKNLIDFKPDIIFSINHFRYSYPWLPQSIPFVSWIQDILPHMRNAKSPNLLTNRDHIFSFSKYMFPDFFMKHPVFAKKTIHFLPIPINNSIYKPLRNIKKIYDVMFTSHIADNFNEESLMPYRLKPEDISTGSDDHKFLCRLARKIDQMSMAELSTTQYKGESLYEILTQKICKEISIDYSKNFLKHFQRINRNGRPTRFLIDLRMMLKIKPVKILLDHGIDVKVFGNNWDTLKGFEAAAMGPIENGEPLNTALNQSKIVLNISPGSSWHMRAADAMGSGAFVLTFIDDTDGTPISDILNENQEFVGFKDEHELVEKVIYFLGKKEKREKISHTALNKLKKNYSSLSHAKKILKTILDSVCGD